MIHTQTRNTVQTNALTHAVRERLHTILSEAALDIQQAARDNLANGDRSSLAETVYVKEENNEFLIATDAEEGRELELGTSTIEARPFLKPAFDSITETLQQGSARGMQRVIASGAV